MPPDRFCDAIAGTPGSSGRRDASSTTVTPLARAISLAWPIRPKPVMSVRAVHGAGERAQHVAARLVQRRHRRDGVSDQRIRRALVLDRGADDAGAEPFGEDQAIAGARAGVGPDAIGVDRAGDRVAELHLGVAHRVAAEQRHAGFLQLVEAAEKDLPDRVAVEDLVRERRRSPAPSPACRPSRRRR